MRAPKPGAIAPARTPDAAGTIASSPTTQAFFNLTSDAWTPGGAFPVVMTCDGANTSPPLAISAVPPGTVELAIVMTDPDADDYVHWVATAINPSTVSIAEGNLPEGSIEAEGTAGEAGYSGPCPPAGKEHTYEFTLYALSSPSAVTENMNSTDAIAAIEAQSTTRAVLTGTYKRSQ